MKGNVAMTNVNESGTYRLAPEGIHEAGISEITDKESTNGDPMVSVKLVITSSEGLDCVVWDNILIPEPDSPSAKILGRTKHFLHCIGESYEGDIEWNSDNWVLKRCKIRISHEPPNEYHSYTKAVVEEYVLNGDMKQEDDTPF